MKNYLIYLLAAVSCTTVADLKAQVSTKTGNETTKLIIPKKFYKDSIDFSNAPKRLNNKYPLSDQKNEGGWVLNKKASDEFKGKKLNEERWFPNNPKWKGRQPTFFAKENTTFENGCCVMRTYKPEAGTLPEGYTHTAGFLVSKELFLYGYFEARLRPNDSPWVFGFWMSNNERDWWTEIDICENCPGNPVNRHDLNSNVHVFKAPADKGDIKKHIDFPSKYYIPFELQKDFHVWGLDWSKEYIRLYIDGILYREIENKYWHQPLRINLNNESNKWFGALPDDNNMDSEYLIDYVRVWNKKEK